MRSAPEAKVYPISWNLSVGAAAARNVHVLQSGEKKKNTLRSLFSHPAPTSLRTQPRNDCVCNQSRYFSESSFVLFFCVTFVLSCHLLLWSVCRRDVGELSHGWFCIFCSWWHVWSYFFFPFSVISNPCFQNVYYILALVLLASAEYQGSS